MQIESIYTNTFYKKKKYYMYVNAPLCSIIEISRTAYTKLRLNAVRVGFKVIECADGNEKLETTTPRQIPWK